MSSQLTNFRSEVMAASADDGAKLALGLRIRELREERGLTREDLSVKAGVPVTSLINWEVGHREPMAFQLRKLSVALSVPCDSLFDVPAGGATPRGRGRPKKAEGEPPQ